LCEGLLGPLTLTNFIFHLLLLRVEKFVQCRNLLSV
jgi:hypothetical protein